MSAVAHAWRPLRALLGGTIDVPADVEVADVTLDSRAVRPGSAFLACRGRQHHGLDFAHAAAAAGARAILWEPAPGVSPPSLDRTVLLVAVPDLSVQAGFIADRFFGAPTARLAVAGITGTNGKTTCAWLLAQALSHCGRPASYLGTLGVGPIDALRATAHTTPDAITVHRLLAAERDAGAKAIAMEVSSHALDQHRCAGVRFQAAALTNLTRDHLDYHGSMEAYAEAKTRLFDWPTLGARVINIDDTWGAQLAARLHHGAQLVLTSSGSGSWPAIAAQHVRAVRSEATAAGLRLELQTSWGDATLQSPLIGDFNVDNLLTVLGLLLSFDISLQSACEALAHCTPPPGRMQTRGGGAQLPLVVIDYAHTPDALEKALRATRGYVRGNLWCVFGCGGDRDAGKRAAMGRVAEQLADRIIVTDDNPRNENPDAIVAAIVSGMSRPGQALVIHDRGAAIAAALAQAAAGDVVLVAGKGHEQYQLIGGERRSFSDLASVNAALAARSAA